jgi:N-acetyl-anhydromuramyl-L-alanine amidase AmpD
MSVLGQAGAIWMPVPANNIFPNYWGNTPKWLVIHKTASGGTAQDIANFFINDPAEASSHYIIGLDGTLVQCVSESDGAGANGILETGHAAYLPANINLNCLTLSIEHVDASPQNSTALTDAQKATSFKLIHDICVRHNIPMRAGDANGGIIKHADIAPIDRALCPNNYPWTELFAYLGGNMIPTGWKDDGTTLTAPNGVKAVAGFREYVLADNWDKDNWPLQAEAARTPLEDSNPSLGGGTWQPFRWTTLEYTTKRGVFVAWTGQELLYLRQHETPAPAPTIDTAAIIAALKTLETYNQTAIQSALKILGAS